MSKPLQTCKWCVLVLQIFISVDSAFAQNIEVIGTVTDVHNKPIPGVAVSVTGGDALTATNSSGDYTVSVPAGTTLAFSSVGYRTEEVLVGTRRRINVTLVEDLASLDEVVVVGYGAQKRVNVIGAVTSVSGAKLESIPASDVTNAISGRLPGTAVTQPTGEPGQNSANIRVRGRTTLGDGTGPLVVIDGMPGRVLSEVDPVDIESISVLKDASSAIYGTQAANGVILVTTKRGRSGKPRLNYQVYQGFMTPTMLPKVLSAGDYATMLSEYQDYEGQPRTFSDRDIELFYSGEDPWEHPNTNWMNDLVADWTTSSKHNLTIDGGTASGVQYYVSLGYRNEEAIYKQESTRYRQYNLRGKLDIPITDWLKGSVDYAGYIPSRFYPTNPAPDIYGQSTRLLPTQWSFWPTGEPGPDIEYGDNPVVTSTLEGGYNDNKEYKNEATFRLTIAPPILKGLTLNGMFSYDLYNRYQKIFRKPWTLYFPDWDSAQRDENGFITTMDLVPTQRGYSAPELQENFERNNRQLANVNVTYTRDVGMHSFTLFGAYEQLKQNANSLGAFRRYYISDIVQTINAGSDTEKDNSGTMEIYARQSWIARLNYNYRSKYLVELLLRRDGSLKFPPRSRWGNFPAVLLGWQASEEPFWKEHIKFFSYFKLRATYGKMGMDPGAAFQYMNKYNLNTGVAMGSGKDIEIVVRQAGVANPFITWEKQTTYNLGFDSYFLEDKFHLNTEFFYNKRSDILAPRNASVPDYTGLELPDENIAEVENRGFEIDLGYHQQFNEHFRLDVSGNVSWTRNKVIFTDEPARAVPWQTRTGHPFGALLLYNAIGIFADDAALEAYPHWTGAKPGDVIFEDVSGDGTINSDDQILLDRADAPELFMGLSVDLRYKNWSLSVLAQGQGTYYRPNFADVRRGEAGNYFQWNFDNRWTTENRHTDVARAFNRSDEYWGFDVNRSTYWYDNMAYIRLKNVVLTYDIPKQIFGNSGISNTSIFLSGNNLFLIYAAQKNFDPEIGSPLIYPAIRTLAVGARITF
jgi:TonB-linked outer membrane protein, SusC/RagA family